MTNNKKLDKVNKNNFNKNNYPSKNQLYHYNNYEKFENTINKYSMKLFEKLKANDNNSIKNKAMKPIELTYNVNSNLNIFSKSTNKNVKDMIKTIRITNNKEKKDNRNNSNSNKLQKENKNNLSSSYYTNTNNLNNKNEFNKRKYSDNVKRNTPNDLNKVKNAHVSRNFSNVGNNHSIDLVKKDNLNVNNNTTTKKHHIDNNKNKSNIKFIIDLKNNNSNNNITKKIKDNNEILTINSYSSKDNNDNKKIISNEKEKKFSIIDIPAPINYSNEKEKDKIFIKINLNENEDISKDIQLSIKEKAYYILCKSQVLPLSSQFIFSRSCSKIRELITKEKIMENYDIFIQNKIKEYENKIISYNKKITSIFTPSKIAEITFNFITDTKENEFSNNYNSLIYDKKDIHFIYYKNYIKILYYIINENFEDEIKDEKLLSNLYKILNKKGYRNIKDYLYFLFISSKNKQKENCFMKNIDNIQLLINNEVPKFLCFQESTKICKFIGFSLYLIKEIIDFGNIIKNTINLKIETTSFIEELKENLVKFRNRYIK